MSTVEENLHLMQILDDTWNAQDWTAFEKLHAAEVEVSWPGRERPTHGWPSHREEVIAFFTSFPDNTIGNRPYRALFGQGDWTCSVADFTGTFQGPMTTPDGDVHQPTGKRFLVEFCTVIRWKDGKVIEEKIFFDRLSFAQQLGMT